MSFRPFDFSRRKIRQIIAGVGGEKIIDVVLARIHPGHECRPRHRRNRRKRRSQLAEGSFVAQLRQVGQPAFVHESVSKFRIHTVESQNYRSLKRRLSICVTPPDKPEQLPERPSHQRIKGIEKRDKDRPERRQHSKSRPPPAKCWHSRSSDGRPRPSRGLIPAPSRRASLP